MPELSLDNINRITADIKKQDINYSTLADELVDHICCEVEKQMENGLSFPEAYAMVRKMFGPRRLIEIQEETLFAVDTKYRRMKNLMKISAITGTVLLGFASLFKIQHWPGAGILITLGAMILALAFMPSALGVLWKETRNGNKLFLFVSSFFAALFFITGTLFKIQHWPGAGHLLLLAAASGLLLVIPASLYYLFHDRVRKDKKAVYVAGAAGLVFFITGMLFKIQHWPFAALMMVTGFIILGVLALPWYSWISWKEEDHLTSKFLFILTGTLLIVIPAAMINLNLQQSYEQTFIPYLSRQQVMNDNLTVHNYSRIISYRDSLFYPELKVLHSRTAELGLLIRDIGVRMVRQSENKPGSPGISPEKIIQTENGPRIIYGNLSHAFSREPVLELLSPASESRKNLEAAFKDYSDYVSSVQQSGEINRYLELLSLEKYLPAGSELDNVTSMMSELHSLEILRNNLLVVEGELINRIAGNR